MTATTDATTATPEFTEESGWEAIRRANGGEFGGGSMSWTTTTNDRGSLGAALAGVVRQHSRQAIEGADPRMMRQAIIDAGYALRGTNDEHMEALRQAVLAVMDDLAGGEPEDASTPEVKADRTKTALRIIRESGWPIQVWLTGTYGDVYDDHWSAIVETLTYQYDNWARGVYLSNTQESRLDQFKRRLSRNGQPYVLTARAERILKGIQTNLWNAARNGEIKDGYFPASPSTEFWSEMAKRWRGEEGTEDAQGVGYGHSYWGYSDASYYLGAALEYWHDAMPELPDEDREFTEENLKKQIDKYTSEGRSSEFDQARLSAFVEHVQSVITGGGAAVPPEIKSAEALIEFLIGQEESLPDFYVAAITNGVLDTVDRFREGEKVENAVNTLRREVRKYGYLKFTGRRVSRSTMDGILGGLRDEVAGKPLTVDEWRARDARFRMAVQYVAGRYGEVQGMCSVLETATAELGLDPIRKPKRIARMEGDGLVVDIPVETWRDTSNGLLDVAQQAWSKMTPDEKEAAIVSRKGVHVNWSAMRSTF